MARIQILDQNTINQIAAGEVVERPASVVKELLENAIDAGATAVTIEIKDGGIRFIRITDNGCGIPKEQIPLAFLRHSTSKIRSAGDLDTVASLGFRGEALSSIAAVSQVELISKPIQSLTGTCYCIEGGAETSSEEIGAPEGTTILVRNLFYNVPARRKFLKTPMTEGNYINELVEKMALSHPNVSIRLINNGHNKLYTTGNHNLKDLIYTVYGREIAGNLLPIHVKMPEISIDGFLGKPVIARGNRSFENYFINGRYVKSGLIAKAIETAYKPFMMQHRYPFTVLHIWIEPKSIDVNVHPAKMELRFKNEVQIYETLSQQLSTALNGKEFIPEVELVKRKEEIRKKEEKKAPEPFEKKRLETETLCQLASYGKEEQNMERKKSAFRNSHSAKKQLLKSSNSMDGGSKPLENKQKDFAGNPPEKLLENQPKDNHSEKQNLTEVKYGTNEKKRLTIGEGETEYAGSQTTIAPKNPEQMSLFQNVLLSEKARSKHRLIGQLFDTYWLIQYEDKLFIMDQHAAHEKVLYEQTLRSLKNKEFTSQMVSPPWIISLSTREESILKKYEKNFIELGYEISHFGGKEYAVSAIPGNLFGISEKDMLIELFSQLEEELGNQASQLITEKIASLSCKAAVKGNHPMTFQEANALIDQLLQLDNPYACPHGRPTIISMSRYELEKKFKRVI